MVHKQEPMLMYCAIDGPPPQGYSSWGEWINDPVKKFAYIRAVTPEDFHQKNVSPPKELVQPPRLRTFEICVLRHATQHRWITVKAENEEEARFKALEGAPNLDFGGTEKEADYEVDEVKEVDRGR